MNILGKHRVARKRPKSNVRMGRCVLAALVLSLSWSWPASARDVEHSVRHGGLERFFRVHLPPQYRKDGSLAMIMVFHGGGGNIDAMVRETRMNDTADERGFIVVYPAGTSNSGQKFLLWNAGYCCGTAADQNVDDIGFVRKLIDFVVAEYGVDAHRVYATGHSNGAMLSFRLACELSDKIAAIAPNSGHGRAVTCPAGARPVPVLYFHGTKDRGLPLQGGTCGGMFQEYLQSMGLPANKERAMWPCDSVQAVLENRALQNGCSRETRETAKVGRAACASFRGCPPDGEVEYCLLQGAGHTWPGGQYGIAACETRPSSKACVNWKEFAGEINRDISANEMMWSFFSKHRLP